MDRFYVCAFYKPCVQVLPNLRKAASFIVFSNMFSKKIKDC